MTAPVPEKTKSYTPVEHKKLIGFVEERLDLAGFERESLNVEDAKDGKIMIAHMGLKHKENDEFRQQFVTVNSYNKSKPVSFYSGAHVFVCSNGMVVTEATVVRKHTTNIWDELEVKADQAIVQLENNWKKTLEDVNRMKQTEMTRTQMAETAGRLYFEQHILRHTETSIVARELKKPTFEDFSALTLWALYNACTYALRQANAARKNEAHKALHDFCLAQANS